MSAHSLHRVVILGGYGNFGKRLVTILSKDPTLEIWIVGRHIKKAQALRSHLESQNAVAKIHALALDWHQRTFAEKLKEVNPFVVIHTAGPFQDQDYTVAKICIDLKIHYIDLSDGREFVVNITQLDAMAKKNEVTVISGASSVPGLSMVVIETYAKKFGILREIDFGIVPGHNAERGFATLAGILKYLGKPFSRLEKGKWKIVYGWQNFHRHYYGDNLGMRWHANLDIPDLALLPQKYSTLKTAIFHTGLEVSFLHFVMWQLSWLVRAHLVTNFAKLTRPIAALSHWFDNYGTDNGGMYIHMTGSNLEYQPLEINWTLVAEKGDGPYIPVLATVIVLKKLCNNLISSGAYPCVDMFALKEFEEIMTQWNIYTTLEEKET